MIICMLSSVVSLITVQSNRFLNPPRFTVENDEIPDSQDRVPAGQGREEGEEPWHHEVD